jgi:hypothetical protein
MDLFEPMIQVGQAKLQSLQRNLAALGGNVKLSLHKTFDDYIREAEARRVIRRRGNGGVGPSSRSDNSVGPVRADEPVATLDEALRRLGLLASTDEKSTLVASLTEPLRGNVISHLKAEKTRVAREKKQAEEQDLKDLF